MGKEWTAKSIESSKSDGNAAAGGNNNAAGGPGKFQESILRVSN
jgi:hypothetical protein